jgi:hypothetical protein
LAPEESIPDIHKQPKAKESHDISDKYYYTSKYDVCWTLFRRHDKLLQETNRYHNDSDTRFKDLLLKKRV